MDKNWRCELITLSALLEGYDEGRRSIVMNATHGVEKVGYRHVEDKPVTRGRTISFEKIKPGVLYRAWSGDIRFDSAEGYSNNQFERLLGAKIKDHIRIRFFAKDATGEVFFLCITSPALNGIWVGWNELVIAEFTTIQLFYRDKASLTTIAGILTL